MSPIDHNLFILVAYLVDGSDHWYWGLEYSFLIFLYFNFIKKKVIWCMFWYSPLIFIFFFFFFSLVTAKVVAWSHNKLQHKRWKEHTKKRITFTRKKVSARNWNPNYNTQLIENKISKLLDYICIDNNSSRKCLITKWILHQHIYIIPFFFFISKFIYER